VYKLTAGSGVSEICSINSRQFLVDERDGRGREGNDDLSSNDARVKKLFKIDLDGVTDISNMDGLTAVIYAVNKTLFLDLVVTLTNNRHSGYSDSVEDRGRRIRAGRPDGKGDRAHSVGFQ